jgi:hypothetical protein
LWRGGEGEEDEEARDNKNTNLQPTTILTIQSTRIITTTIYITQQQSQTAKIRSCISSKRRRTTH